jgi:hypothetical protein
MSKNYYVSIEREFMPEERDTDVVDQYLLGAWEESFPEHISEFWNGHGTALGYGKLTIRSLFKPGKGRKRKGYIRAYDVGYSCNTLEEAQVVFRALEPFVTTNVNLRLSAHAGDVEEE